MLISFGFLVVFVNLHSKKQEILEAENQRLSALRDSLFPKLMSGELDVSKIEF